MTPRECCLAVRRVNSVEVFCPLEGSVLNVLVVSDKRTPCTSLNKIWKAIDQFLHMRARAEQSGKGGQEGRRRELAKTLEK